MQEERPSASLVSRLSSTHVPTALLSTQPPVGGALPTLLADAFTASHARLVQGSSTLFGFFR